MENLDEYIPSSSILAYLKKLSNYKLVQIMEILKGSITTNPHHEERVHETLGLQFLRDFS